MLSGQKKEEYADIIIINIFLKIVTFPNVLTKKFKTACGSHYTSINQHCTINYMPYIP